MGQRGIIGKKHIKERIKRPARWRRYPYYFLIVCEDEKTEPYYFGKFVEKFPEETVFLRAVGTGRSSKGVVERSIIEKQILAEQSNKVVDEVWVVFDKDDAELSAANTMRFKEAFKIAQNLQHKVAYSNEVFELWLLLHISNVSHDKPLPRQDIYSSINDKVKRFTGYENFEYEHGNTNIVDIIAKIGDEDRAIERAYNLLKNQSGIQPIEANPSTTVFILVKRLRELIEYYSYIPD